MKKARHGRRLPTVALLVLAWVILGMSVPIFLNFDPDDFSLRSAQVTAAPRDTYTIATPVRLAEMPGIVLERGTVQLVSEAAGAAVPGNLRAMLEAGSAHLVLDNAAIALGAPPTPEDPAPIDATAPLVGALVAGHFERVYLRRSRITVMLGSGQSEALTNVTAELQNKRKGGHVVKGAGQLRGHQVSFTLTLGAADRRAGAGPATAPATGFPLKATIKSRLLDASIDGRVDVSGGIGVNGRADLAISDLRQLARSLGASWPLGPGLKELKVSGPIRTAGRSISFEAASVLIDQNAAGGTLTARFDGERPSFSGTLAFKALDLGRYGLASVSGAEHATGLAVLRALASHQLDLPLVRVIDADLRLSTGRLLIGGSDLGQSAATVTVKASRLLADVAELAIGTARGGGQIQVDMSAAQPRTVLRARIDDLALEGASEQLLGMAAVSGRGSLTADLTSSASTFAAAGSGLGGRITLRVPAGGRLAYDHRALHAQAGKGDIAGWKSILRGATAFDTLDARIAVRDGVAHAEEIAVRSGDQLLTIAGTVGGSDGRIDVRVVSRAVPPPGAAPRAEPEKDAKGSPALLLRGPVGEPTLSLERPPGKAAERRMPWRSAMSE